MILRSITGVLLGASLLLPMAAHSAKFSIVYLTDMQFYAEQHPEILEAQIDWIVDPAQAGENIVAVVQTGDLKDDQFCDDRPIFAGTGAGRTEWQIVSQAFSKLDTAGIPYSVVPGNHDFNPVSNFCPNWTTQRPLGQYNTRFGPARFAGDPFYGDPSTLTPGNRVLGSNEDNFTLFDSNGIGFIAINLAFRADLNPVVVGNPELAWADNLLKTYPNRLGILTSHFFMETNDPATNTLNELGAYGQAVYDALSNNPNLFMMLAGHWYGEAWLTETTGRAVLQPVQVMMANYQDQFFPDDGDPNTPPDTPDPAQIDFTNIANRGGTDSGFMRIMRFDTDTGMVDVETFIPPVVAPPAKNRTGTIVSTNFVTSGANMGRGTASNFSFSFEDYVPLPSPPPLNQTGSLANDQFLRFLGGQIITEADINSRCADRDGCRITLTRVYGTAAPTVFGPINFFYDPATNRWRGGAVTETGINGSQGPAVILGAAGGANCYFSDWDSSTATGIPDRNLNWSVIIGNSTSTLLTCTITIED